MHARNYRPVRGQAYTRKKFAKGFPPPKIVKFTMGNTKGTFEVEAKLVALKRAQIRHSALEAARIATNRLLMDKLVNELEGTKTEGVKIHSTVLTNKNLLKGFDAYIQDNHIDMLSLTSPEYGIWHKLFNPDNLKSLMKDRDGFTARW